MYLLYEMIYGVVSMWSLRWILDSPKDGPNVEILLKRDRKCRYLSRNDTPNSKDTNHKAHMGYRQEESARGMDCFNPF